MIRNFEIKYFQRPNSETGQPDSKGTMQKASTELVLGQSCVRLPSEELMVVRD